VSIVDGFASVTGTGADLVSTSILIGLLVNDYESTKNIDIIMTTKYDCTPMSILERFEFED
jgi:hypothetical protein